MKSCCKIAAVVFAMAVLLAAAYLYFTPFAPGLKPGPEPETAAEPAIRIGTVDMETLFLSYHGMEEFNKKAQAIQDEYMKAQEDEEAAKLFELQQKFQAAQMELFQDFEDAVARTAALVSGKMGISVITADIIYQGDKAEVVDVTGSFLGTEHFAQDIPAVQGWE